MACIVTGGRGAPFFPSGMFKNGDSSNLPTSFTQVATWTADTGPYPGSTVVSNGLIVQTTRAGVLVAANILMSNASAAAVSGYIQIKQGATVIASAGPVSLGSFGGTGTAICSATVDVTAGDSITLEARCSSGSVVVKSGSANSWVRVTAS